MRVISGSAKSLPLKTPEGLNTRPVTDRLKETLFNILTAYIPGSVFLDMFSGSGGIGIEALSRGASHAFFIDSSKEAEACINQNLVFTHLKDKATVYRGDFLSALSHIETGYSGNIDIVFMDPPYGKGLEFEALKKLVLMKQVKNETLIILEAPDNENLMMIEQEGFQIIRQKKYKTNQHIFIKKRSE